MSKFFISMGLILFGLLSGYLVQRLVLKASSEKKLKADKYCRNTQTAIIAAVNPVIYAGTFWILEFSSLKLAAVPFLNTLAILTGGFLAVTASKALKHKRKQTGSMFVSGGFSNTLTFGGLVCYMFYGEISFGFVSIYRFLEDFVFFTIGFPIAKRFSDEESEIKGRINFKKVLLDPFTIFPSLGILTGIALNLSGVHRPLLYGALNSILIPASSILLVATIGYRMKFTAVNRYLIECLSIAAIKFLVVPAVITTAAYFLGLGYIYNGLVLKVVLILSAMPPAIISLIPPQIYDLDVDLANSSWLFNAGAMFIFLPILFLLQGHLFG